MSKRIRTIVLIGLICLVVSSLVTALGLWLVTGFHRVRSVVALPEYVAEGCWELLPPGEYFPFVLKPDGTFELPGFSFDQETLFGGTRFHNIRLDKNRGEGEPLFVTWEYTRQYSHTEVLKYEGNRWFIWVGPGGPVLEGVETPPPVGSDLSL